jgi:hypothetical protein
VGALDEYFGTKLNWLRLLHFKKYAKENNYLAEVTLPSSGLQTPIQTRGKQKYDI